MVFCAAGSVDVGSDVDSIVWVRQLSSGPDHGSASAPYPKPCVLSTVHPGTRCLARRWAFGNSGGCRYHIVYRISCTVYRVPHIVYRISCTAVASNDGRYHLRGARYSRSAQPSDQRVRDMRTIRWDIIWMRGGDRGAERAGVWSHGLVATGDGDAPRRGKPVYVEKPMARTVAECERMLGACWAAASGALLRTRRRVGIASSAGAGPRGAPTNSSWRQGIVRAGPLPRRGGVRAWLRDVGVACRRRAHPHAPVRSRGQPGRWAYRSVA